MAGPASLLSIGATVALLALLFYGVYMLLRAFEKEGRKPGQAEHEASASRPEPVKKPTIPASVELEPYTGSKDYFAGSPEALEAHSALIDKAGMNRIGDFAISQMPGYFLRAFTHPERNFVGIIYRDPAGKIWLNLQTEYSDGRIITTTSMEKGAAPQPRPHGMPIYHYPGITAERLLRRHKLEVRGIDQAAPLPPEAFAAKYAANYQRIREIWKEAGAETPQRETPHQETRSAPSEWGMEPDMEAAGPSQADGPSQAQPAEELAEDSPAPTMEQMRAWLELIYKRVGVPRERREAFRQGLVWISERASRDAVISTLREYAGVRLEPAPGDRLVILSKSGAEDIVDTAGLSGAALFEKINSRLPEESRFTRLPVVAEEEGVTFFSRRADFKR